MLTNLIFSLLVDGILLPVDRVEAFRIDRSYGGFVDVVMLLLLVLSANRAYLLLSLLAAYLYGRSSNFDLFSMFLLLLLVGSASACWSLFFFFLCAIVTGLPLPPVVAYLFTCYLFSSMVPEMVPEIISVAFPNSNVNICRTLFR